MDYYRIVELIPAKHRSVLVVKLVDLMLTSKNDERMLGQLANTILYHWQRDALGSQAGLSALLEASLLLEPEKTVGVFREMQMADVAGQIEGLSKA